MTAINVCCTGNSWWEDEKTRRREDEKTGRREDETTSDRA